MRFFAFSRPPQKIMKEKIKKEWGGFCLLLRQVPSLMLALFVLSVFAMNLLANKSINTGTEYLALDCGIVVSWVAFLTMDVLTKHFGPKAATQLSVLAIVINLVFSLLLFAVSRIPGVWSQGDEAAGVAINGVFGGTWFVVLGSTVAFVASAIVNNFFNYFLGKVRFKKPDGLGAFVLRSYVSTALGQFIDNLLFALLVCLPFFGWSFVQCVLCALFGMAAELACEAAFSFAGFAVCRRWKALGVGKEYFAYFGTESENAHSDHGNE